MVKMDFPKMTILTNIHTNEYVKNRFDAKSEGKSELFVVWNHFEIRKYILNVFGE